jgi:hypothetical protein
VRMPNGAEFMTVPSEIWEVAMIQE